MRIRELFEDGRIVKGVNTTVDVGPNEITKQAAKFGFKVDKDGRPQNHPSKVKGSKTNVAFNLGITESKNFAEALGEIASSTQIYVDMDGVLADFFGEWAKLMQVDHFTDIDKQHDINDALQKIRDTDDFWLRLPILPEAKNLLNLIKEVKGEYSICTSPLADDPNSEKHKRTWVEKNLAFFPPKEVFVTHNKPQFATAKDGTPNILIDDYGVNINAWEAAGGIGFKYKDHKFERTANAIKQHMQEPVAENKETNKKTQDAATQKAKPYDLPIRKDIADLIMKTTNAKEKININLLKMQSQNGDRMRIFDFLNSNISNLSESSFSGGNNSGANNLNELLNILRPMIDNEGEVGLGSSILNIPRSRVSRPQVNVVPDENLVNNLKEMGFPEDQCRRALISSRNDISRATDLLLSDGLDYLPNEK